MERRPNFFIVGAPKCGTTALSEYLRAHRNVFLSWPKEPHFFATDLHKFNREWIVNERDYLRLFTGARAQHLAIGEASVLYLFSEIALTNIKEFDRNARIIVILRNPVEACRSLHSHLLRFLDEDEADFETAWALQSTRSTGSNIPPTCRMPPLLGYRRVADYYPQMRRLLAQFSQDQVVVLLQEELVRSPQKVYGQALSFLGVGDDGRSKFSRFNENRRVRLKWLLYLNTRAPFRVRRLVRGLKRLLSLEKHQLLSPLYWTPEERRPLDSHFRHKLEAEFRPSIVELGHLLQRDLVEEWFPRRRADK